MYEGAAKVGLHSVLIISLVKFKLKIKIKILKIKMKILTWIHYDIYVSEIIEVVAY